MTTVVPNTLPLRSNAARKKSSRHPQKVVQFRQVLPAALEIDAQHDWDAEDELSMWNWIEDVVGGVFPELNRFLRVATRAKPAALA